MDTQDLLKSATREQIEAWCRSRAQALYLGDRVLCRVLGKYLVYAPSSDRSLMPHLALDGYWEIWITMAMAEFVRPGMTCIDVGANVGYYSVLMADWVGPKGTIVAIEPEERNYRCLSANLDNAECTALTYRLAASDKEGIADFVVHSEFGGNHTIGSTPDASSDRVQQEQVRTVTLDQLSVALTRLDLIKMDVEGHERAVWRGMTQLLERFPEVQIVAEWLRGCDPACEFGQMAIDAGFKLYDVRTDGKLGPIELSDVVSADWRMLWCAR